LKALILPFDGICGPPAEVQEFPVLYIEIFSSGLVNCSIEMALHEVALGLELLQTFSAG